MTQGRRNDAENTGVRHRRRAGAAPSDGGSQAALVRDKQILKIENIEAILKVRIYSSALMALFFFLRIFAHYLNTG